MQENTLLQNNTVLFTVVAIELTLKGIALWKSAKNGQKYWFVALLVINSMGILPLFYLGLDWYKNKDLRKVTPLKRIISKIKEKLP